MRKILDTGYRVPMPKGIALCVYRTHWGYPMLNKVFHLERGECKYCFVYAYAKKRVSNVKQELDFIVEACNKWLSEHTEPEEDYKNEEYLDWFAINLLGKRARFLRLKRDGGSL